MAGNRSIGRPKRNSGDAGRDRLVAAGLELLREPQIELNRKNLAVLAGVTPALVTYYFPDQLSLIEAVARPLVQRYLDELHVILDSEQHLSNKLLLLVKLLLRISRHDGRLLDGYIDFVKRNPQTQGLFLERAYQSLTKFFRQCEETGLFRKSNTAFSQTALWGLCKTVAQTQGLAAFIIDGAASEVEIEDKQAAMIIDFMLLGIGAHRSD